MTGERIVVAGGGFGGLYAAMYLAQAESLDPETRVLLISRSNFFTFTPLLAEVVSGSLGSEHVTVPYRVLGRARGFDFLEATVEGVAADAGAVETTSGRVPYDYLILGLGAEPRYFGNPELRRSSHSLGTVGDARRLHDRVVEKAEDAARCGSRTARRRALTFAVAGAGPAGVEVASEIWEFLSRALPRYYGIHEDPRVVIYEGGSRILRGWDPELAAEGLEELRTRGVEVRLGTRVTGFDDGVVRARTEDEDRSVEADTLVWTAGTKPATGSLEDAGLPLGERGHVRVDPFLRAEDRENVFAVGDMTTLENPRTGRPYPPVAPIAISQGVRAAGNVENAVAGRELEPYRAHHAGKIVSLGGGVALVDVLGWTITGPVAWALYRATYLLKLVGAKNKIRAATTLLLNRFFERDLTGS